MSVLEVSPVFYPDSPVHQRPTGVNGEWELVPSDRWNLDQRIAAATHGVVTLANATTLLGAAITHNGIKDLATNHPVRGTIKIMAGRTADLLDGKIAQWRGTRSAVGAATDAGVDKLLLTDACLMLTRAHILPPHLTTATLIAQTRIMAKNTTIKQHGGEPNPNQHGKHAMFASWTAIGSYCLANVFETRQRPTLAKTCTTVALAAELAATAYSVRAIAGYDQQITDLSSSKL
jgi:phosphatidylglycerophosphate synthase